MLTGTLSDTSQEAYECLRSWKRSPESPARSARGPVRGPRAAHAALGRRSRCAPARRVAGPLGCDFALRLRGADAVGGRPGGVRVCGCDHFTPSPASSVSSCAIRKYLFLPKSPTVLMLKALLSRSASPSLTPARALTGAARISASEMSS